MQAVKRRTNVFTPNNARYACVGLYRFKGIKKDQELYAVGTTIESLQPPPSSDKVKRIGGPKKIRSKARDRALFEWVWWLCVRLAVFFVCWLFIEAYPALSNQSTRQMWGHDWLFWWVDYIDYFVQLVRSAWHGVLEDVGVK